MKASISDSRSAYFAEQSLQYLVQTQGVVGWEAAPMKANATELTYSEVEMQYLHWKC
jgi:hypothetical protein